MNESSHYDFTDMPIELGELTGSLGFLLRLAQVKVFQSFYDTQAALGLKPGEFTVLWVIGLNPDRRQGEIAQILNIKPAHMTKLVQRMFEAGFVSREIPREDRRSVRLSLTDAGRQFVDRHKADFLEFHRFERAGLDDREFGQFVTLLQNFIGMGEAK